MREILGAALDLACEGGLDNLTLHALAARMERSVAAVYRYFPSKEAVIGELQRLVATHIRLINIDTARRIDAWAEDKGLTPAAQALARLIGAGQAYELFAAEAPAEFGLLTHYLGSSREELPERDVEAVLTTARGSLDRLAEDFEAAAKAGALTPGNARERTLIHWGALQGVIQIIRVLKRGGGWTATDDLADATLRNLLRGWGGDAELIAELATEIRNEKFARATRTVRDLLDDMEAA